MEGYISEIRYFGGNFSPLNWNYCQGQLMSIAEYTALYSLIGTIYGGDGQTTFALPNLAGRIAVGTGSGPGLPPVQLGEAAGTENVTMLNNNMPGHVHSLVNYTVNIPVGGAASSPNVGAGYMFGTTGNDEFVTVKDGAMKPVNVVATTGVTGQGLPFSVLQPYLVLSPVICVEGIYPSRS